MCRLTYELISRLPTDLAGVTLLTFEPHNPPNLRSSLGAASTLVEEQIKKYGLKEARRLRILTDAAQDIDDASVQMQRLIKLIARSRKVEIDIISQQFGPLISKEHLQKMKRDLQDLEETLRNSEDV